MSDAAVLETNQAFYRAFEKKDLEAMEAVWSHGTGTICIHPGRTALKGWEAIRNSWATIFRNTRYLEIDTEITHIEINGSLAYVVLVESVLQAHGRQSLKARSLATNVFECMAGRWYMIHHHGSPIA